MGEPIFKRMLDADDKTADSIVFLSLVAGIGLVLITAWDVGVNGREFKLQDFGIGAGAIIGALGGAKWARDGRPRVDQPPGEKP